MVDFLQKRSFEILWQWSRAKVGLAVNCLKNWTIWKQAAEQWQSCNFLVTYGSVAKKAQQCTQPISLAHNGARPGWSKQWKDTVMGELLSRPPGPLFQLTRSHVCWFALSVIFSTDQLLLGYASLGRLPVWTRFCGEGINHDYTL